MKRIRLALALALLATGPAAAHDFWLRADRFQAPGDAKVRVLFEINKAPTPEPWDLRTRKVVSFWTLGPGGLVDQQAGVVATGKDGYADVAVKGEGTHLLAFESTQQASDLTADRFDPYVAEEGLTAVAKARGPKPTGNGREVYSRRAKVLIQVGGAKSTVSTPIGQTLEIVPLANPYGLDAAAPLPVQVLWRGKPLSGATVHIARLGPDPKEGVAIAKTDADGKASLAFPKAGAWKVVCVWSEPVTGEPGADFQTVFSSLTFGY